MSLENAIAMVLSGQNVQQNHEFLFAYVETQVLFFLKKSNQ